MCFEKPTEYSPTETTKPNRSISARGLDGGMNKVFLAQFPGIIIPLAKVLLDGSLELPQLEPIPCVNNRGSVTSRLFGSNFGHPLIPKCFFTFGPLRIEAIPLC